MPNDLEIHDEAGPADAAARILPGGRCVILLHALPDGSSHFDWLLETVIPAGEAETDEARTLAAFRSQHSPDALQRDSQAELHAIALHRRRYLHFEGPLGGNRGEVRRVRSGVIENVEMPSSQPAELTLGIRWDHAPGRPARSHVHRLLRDGADRDRWRLCCIRVESRAE